MQGHLSYVDQMGAITVSFYSKIVVICKGYLQTTLQIFTVKCTKSVHFKERSFRGHLITIFQLFLAIFLLLLKAVWAGHKIGQNEKQNLHKF